MAFDLDGTLLMSDRGLSARTVRVLQELDQAGVIITLVTARNFTTSVPVADQLPIRIPIICLNGALWWNPADRSIQSFHPLCENSVVDIFQFVDDQDIEMTVIDQKGGGYLRRSRGSSHVWMDGTLKSITSLSREASTDGLLRLFAYGPHNAGMIYDRFNERLPKLYFTRTFETGDLTSLAVTSPLTNKGIALLNLAEQLGISPQDIAAFGDSEADLPMIQQVGHGVVMENAMPFVRSQVSRVAPHHNADGVARYIESTWLL